ERIAEPLRSMGAAVETTDGHAPLVVEGGQLWPIRYELPVASAQVKSCILLAGLYASSGPTVVVERYPSRDHTERMLVASGAGVASEVGEAEVPQLVDELPLFALAAGLARGESVVKGAQELRVKESDRIETVTNVLGPLGIRISGTHDGFRVRGVPSRP